MSLREKLANCKEYPKEEKDKLFDEGHRVLAEK